MQEVRKKFNLIYIPFDDQVHNKRQLGVEKEGDWYVGVFNDTFKAYMPALKFGTVLCFDDMHRIVDCLCESSTTGMIGQLNYDIKHGSAGEIPQVD